MNLSSTLIGGSLNEERLTNEILSQLFIRFEDANQWLDAVTNFGQATADILNLRLARSSEVVVEFQIAK